MGSGERRRAAMGACTESLGSESGDGGSVEIDQLPVAASAAEEAAGFQRSPEKRRRTEQRLPPSMQRPDAFMRAERRGGRLILTEVRIERQEVFHVSRDYGRLRLRFAGESDGGDEPARECSNGGKGKSCSDGGGGFCQVAVAGGRRFDIGAVVGI